MPFYDYVCPNCNKKSEVFVRNQSTQPKCKQCGTLLQRVYCGKMFGATGVKSGGCSGNCKTCSGCK
ncbi:MAG: zinc ribbon domain-containing protein [Clostridia bacterium]|nr:zinc ribbon domain-containing protein [Clostridia bacterium]